MSQEASKGLKMRILKTSPMYIQYLIRLAIARFIPPPILASLSYTRYYVSLFIGEYGAMGCAIIADCQYLRLKKSFSRFRTINLMSQNRPSHGS